MEKFDEHISKSQWHPQMCSIVNLLLQWCKDFYSRQSKLLISNCFNVKPLHRQCFRAVFGSEWTSTVSGTNSTQPILWQLLQTNLLQIKSLRKCTDTDIKCVFLWVFSFLFLLLRSRIIKCCVSSRGEFCHDPISQSWVAAVTDFFGAPPSSVTWPGPPFLSILVEYNRRVIS